jgi:hypothetical protein
MLIKAQTKGEKKLSVDLRVSRCHVIPALHNAPDLPTNGRIAECHDDQWQHEDQNEHVDLVSSPQETSLRITDAPVGDQSQSDFFMRLENRGE